MDIKKTFNDFVNEGKFDGIADLVKSLHFETDPKTAEEKKIAIGKSQGEISKRKQIEGGEYSLRRFRKEIKFGDGTYLGVFLPGSYDAATSTLGDGPHKKAVKKIKWNQKKYDQWLEDMAANGGAFNAFDMAQNAKNEPGLIDWVKKEFRGDDALQRIQWDIEAFVESVVNEALAPGSKIEKNLNKALKSNINMFGDNDETVKVLDTPVRIERSQYDKEMNGRSKNFGASIMYMYGSSTNEHNTSAVIGVISRTKGTAKVFLYSEETYSQFAKGASFKEYEGASVLEEFQNKTRDIVSHLSKFPADGSANESVVTEGKMPDKLTNDDNIVFLKTSENSKGAHYNVYYKGYDIDFGGVRFGTEKQLNDYAEQLILSRQWANKLRYEDAKPLPESVVTESKNSKEIKELEKLLKSIKSNTPAGQGRKASIQDDIERLKNEAVTEAKINYKETGLSGQNLKDVKDGIIGIKNALKRGNKSAVISNYDLVQQRLQQYGGPNASEFLEKIKQLAGLDESVVTEAKNTIGLAFKEESDYLDFKEFVAEQPRGAIRKNIGFDSKTKSWNVEMDVKVLDSIYGEGTPSDKKSGWYGGLPDDFESVIIESVVTGFTEAKMTKDKLENLIYSLENENDSWHPSSDSKKKSMLDKLKKDLSKFESVVTEEVVYNSSNTKPDAAKKATKEFGKLLPKANKGVEPYVFAVIKTKARNYRLAIKSGSYVAHEFMSGLRKDGILTADIVKKAVANVIKMNPEEFNESVVTEKVVYNSSNTKPEAAKKATKEFGKLLPKANKGVEPYVFAVIKTKARNYRLAIKSGSYVAHEFMSGLRKDGILTTDIVKKAVANVIKLNPEEFNESVVTESKYQGMIAGDAAEDIAKELSYNVKQIVKQPNDSVTYFQVKDKSSVNKTIQSLIDLYGIEAQSGGKQFSPSITVKFDNDQMASESVTENRELMKIDSYLNTKDESVLIDFLDDAYGNSDDRKTRKEWNDARKDLSYNELVDYAVAHAENFGMDLQDIEDAIEVYESVVTEGKFDKKKLMKAMKHDDGIIQLANGDEFIIYNPDNGNDENTAMWNDKVIFALDQDGEEHEVKYSDIVSYNESVVTEAKFDKS